MYFEFLLRRAHSRRRVDRKYWSGDSLYSRTTCSNSVMVGVTGPIGSGLPQFGFPRRFAMNYCLSTEEYELQNVPKYKILRRGLRILGKNPCTGLLPSPPREATIVIRRPSILMMI